MSLNWLRRFAHARLARGRRPWSRAKHRLSFLHPRLETLETRLAPAVHTWTGLGSSNSWGDAGNWSGGTPAGDASPTLVFPSSPRLTSLNDVSGRLVHEIIIQANGYVIGGSAFTLDGALTVDAGVTGSVQVDPQNSPTDTIGLKLHNSPTITVLNPAASLKLGGNGGDGSAPVSGDSGYIKEGDGTLSLAGPDTYTGTTMLTAGTLAIPNLTTGSFGTGTLVLDGGTLYDVSFSALSNPITVGDSAHPAASATISGQVFLNGNITLSPLATLQMTTTFANLSGTLSGAGSLSISGALNILAHNPGYSGTTTIQGGSAAPYYSDGLGTGPVILTGGGYLINTNGSLTLPNAFVVNGSGEITPNQVNSSVFFALTGPGTILPGSTLTAGPGGSENGSTITFSSLGGGGGLTVAAEATVVLSGPASYTGATSISGPNGFVYPLGGTLRAGVENALPNSTNLSIAAGGTLDLQNFDATVGSLTGAGGSTPSKVTTAASGAGTLTVGGNNNSTTFAGVMSGGGGLTKVGTGTLTLSGANAYTGATTVNAGILQLGVANALASATAVTVSSGTLNLNNFNATVGSLAGAGTVALGTATLTTGGSNANTTFSGTLMGTSAGTLVKAGTTGVFTLSGSNTFAVAVSVTAGTLALTGTNTFNGPMTVFGGATLSITTGTDTIAGSLTGGGGVTIGGTQGPPIVTIQGSYNLGGTLTLTSGNVTVATSGTVQNLTLNGTVGTTRLLIQLGATLTVIGTMTFNGGELEGGGMLQIGSGSGGAFNWQGGTMDGNAHTMVMHGSTATVTPSLTTSIMIEDSGFDDEGTTTWTGTGGMWVIGDGATVTVGSMGKFEFEASNARFEFDGGSASLTNNGVLQGDSGASLTLDANVNFNGDGSVNLNGGQLALGNGSSNAGFSVAAGATLVFAGNSFNLSGGQFTGAGNVTFAAGNTTIAVPYGITGTTIVSGGTVSFPAGASLPNLTVTGGTAALNFPQMVTFTNLSIAGSGILSTQGPLTVSHSFSWNGGSLVGPGTNTLTIPAGVTLSLTGASDQTLDGCSLSLAGTATWSGAGSLALRNGASVTIQTMGTLTAQSDASVSWNGAGNSTFINNGTLVKSTGAGGTAATTITAPFTNNGTLNVQAGTLRILGLFTNFSGNTLSGGTYMVAGTLQFNFAIIQVNAAQILLTGPAGQITDYVTGYDALGYLYQNNPGSSFGVENGAAYTTFAGFYNAGTFLLGAGSGLTIGGDLTQDPNGTITFQFGGSPASGQFGQLAVAGNAFLGGTLNAVLVNGYRPNVNDSFTVLTFGAEFGDFGIENLTLGGGLQFVPAYVGNTFTLTAQPGGPAHGGNRGTIVSVSQRWGAGGVSGPAADQGGDGRRPATDDGGLGASGQPSPEDADSLFASLHRHAPADEVDGAPGLILAWSDTAWW